MGVNTNYNNTNSHITANSPITSLTPDLHEAVFPYLGPQAMGALSRTCRSLRLVVQNVLQNETAQRQLLRNCSLSFTSRMNVTASQTWQRISQARPSVVYLATYTGHTSRINCFQITSDGSRALSGSRDTTLKLWDLGTGESLGTFGVHTHSIECLQFTPDGRRALSGSNNGTLILWDLETGRPLQNLAGAGAGHPFGHPHVGLPHVTPDGDVILVGQDPRIKCLQITPDGRRALSGCLNGTLRLWDLETGEALRDFVGQTDISSLQMISEGRRALSGSMDNTLRLWDLETGECLLNIAVNDGLDIRPDRILCCMQITPDERRVLSGSQDSTLRLWDLETGECLQTLDGGTGGIRCLQITPDGRRALSGSVDRSSGLRLWDLETGEHLLTLPTHAPVVRLQITPDGRRVVCGFADGALGHWDLETGEPQPTISSHGSPVSLLKITPDGRKALLGYEAGAGHQPLLLLWDLYPLPEERISQAGRNCILGPIHAVAALPQFAREDVLAIWRRLCRGRAIEPSVTEERNVGLLNMDITAQSLYIYNATQVALPGIAASLRRAENEPLFLAESLRRVANLRPAVRNSVYGNLYEIHRTGGTLPQFIRHNYGEHAFHSERGSSIEDRIEAITRTIGHFERMASGPEAVAQPSVANPLPVTARILVRYQGNAGDRLFLHGTGPGMEQWHRGIEMRHENGVWIYESQEPFERFEFKVMLNGQHWEAGENHTISSGVPIEIPSVTFQGLP